MPKILGNKNMNSSNSRPAPHLRIPLLRIGSSCVSFLSFLFLLRRGKHRRTLDDVVVGVDFYANIRFPPNTSGAVTATFATESAARSAAGGTS